MKSWWRKLAQVLAVVWGLLVFLSTVVNVVVAIIMVHDWLLAFVSWIIAHWRIVLGI